MTQFGQLWARVPTQYFIVQKLPPLFGGAKSLVRSVRRAAIHVRLCGPETSKKKSGKGVVREVRHRTEL